MFDFNMYAATEDNPGGPVYLEEEYSPLSPYYFLYDVRDWRPLTHGRVIGGILSLGMLLGLAAYFIIAI